MQLYPYQERVKALIESGQSIILQAPTGAGKTRAALAPFIESFFDRSSVAFPRKCIYSVPMRTLANQFMAEYHELAASYHRVHHKELTVCIQTGDRPEDSKLESNLIFSTIDQTLSSFLNIPYTLGSGSSNLNAGAILSSYLVFDELHLYDPDTMLPTTLEMLRMLKGITPFIVMTATFSSQMLSRLAEALGAVVVPEDDQARSGMQNVGSQIGKERYFYRVDSQLTAQAVLNPENRGKRTICICNTVHAAQDLYRSLKQSLLYQGDEETIVCLLHSRFYKEDRDQKEEWIKDQFGISQLDYDGPDLILVATQVIEVGVDATCDAMHTELAPAASLLQRAGRCARRANETGHIYIYLRRDEDGEPDFTPYYLKNQARKTQRGLKLCQVTWDEINLPEFSCQNMTFSLEQVLIDRVHQPIDQEILDGISDTRHLRQKQILKTIQNSERGMASELIRDIDSRFVFIHPYPEADEHLTRNPWYYDGFSYSPGSLAKAFQDINEVLPDDIPWIFKSARKPTTIDEEMPSGQPTEYTWYALSTADEVFSSPFLAVHPLAADYDQERGAILGISSGEYRLRNRPNHIQTAKFSYKRESYADHVAGLYRGYINKSWDPTIKTTRLPIKDEIAYVTVRLEQCYKLSPGALDRMIRAIFACHDLGKLNMLWQEWAHKWQKRVSEFYPEKDTSVPDGYMLAHTDFDASDAQKALQRKLGQKPHHAGESAIAAVGLLDQVCDENGSLWQAGFSSISRHHSASTDGYQAFRCHPSAVIALEEALEQVRLPINLAHSVAWENDGRDPFEKGIISFNDPHQGLLIYFLLIRVLRLADQRSQMK